MKTLKVVIVLLVVGSITGCAQEFYVGTRRIDEFQTSQSMKAERSWTCAFIDCGGKYDGNK